MEQKYNLKLVTLIQNDIAVSYNLERLYNYNLGFICTAINSFGVPVGNVEFRKDLLQVSFFAMYDAAIKFDFDKSSNFLTYLKYWLKHYFHMEFMRTQIPFSLSESEYFKIKRLGNLANFRTVDLGYLAKKDVIEGIADRSLFYTFQYEDFHRNTLTQDFWKLVESLLTKTNYEIILLRYKEKLTYSQIGEIYGIGKERVRKRILNSLTRLRHSGKIQIIASDWYGINVTKCLQEENQKWMNA